MVSGYDKNKAGIQVIKVTYEGFTTQFSILVKEEVPATNPDEPNTPDDNKPNTSDKIIVLQILPQVYQVL